MSKNYFNVNDNYSKNCDSITKAKIVKAKRKAKPTPLSQYQKDIKAKNKWLQKHGSNCQHVERSYNPNYKRDLLDELGL